jgi:hypothetical protein
MMRVVKERDALRELLAAVIRGDGLPSQAFDLHSARAAAAAAEAHGVDALVADRLLRGVDAPAEWCAAFLECARRRAAADLAATPALRTALAALADAGCRPLVVKGAHLAYTRYARSDLRPRSDSDVIVPASAREGAERVLLALGYRRGESSGGELITSQRGYVLSRGTAEVHAIDLHWRVANAELFASTLTHDDLWPRRVVIDALGPGACGPSDADALLLGCVHRVAHHFDDDRLIWIYDLHLLASRLTEAEWGAMAERARVQRVAAVCAQGLQHAAAAFGTRLPAPTMAALIEAGARPEESTRAAYARGPRRHIANVAADLRALPRWSDRVRLAAEHVFPPAAYMRGVYAPDSRAPLALLYARRAYRGALRWFAQP